MWQRPLFWVPLDFIVCNRGGLERSPACRRQGLGTSVTWRAKVETWGALTFSHGTWRSPEGLWQFWMMGGELSRSSFLLPAQPIFFLALSLCFCPCLKDESLFSDVWFSSGSPDTSQCVCTHSFYHWLCLGLCEIQDRTFQGTFELSIDNIAPGFKQVLGKTFEQVAKVFCIFKTRESKWNERHGL